MNIDRKYIIDTADNKNFMKHIRDNLLSFGHRFPSPQGGSYWLGDDGTPWTNRNRETWITCRMAHVYSLGMFLGHEGSNDLVDAALRGLITGELRDITYGGWFAGTTPEGTPMPTKQCYAHAFVCLAASSGYLAGIPAANELLNDSQKVYEEQFWEDDTGLSVDTWNTEFTELDSYRGINANMHTVETFLAMADATGDELYRVRAGRIIRHVIEWAVNNYWRIPEHFTSDWIPDLEFNADRPDDPFKPYGATPGHGIEWARLIVQWALSTYSEQNDRMPYIQAAEQLYGRAMTDGWNADGARGIVYTTDWTGAPLVHDRMHWTAAEAVNTSAVLYHVTGNGKYADDYSEVLRYIDEQVIDHVNGSWFHQLDRNNHIMNTVWPGKSDLYHAVQATLIPFYNPAISIATAVKNGDEI